MLILLAFPPNTIMRIVEIEGSLSELDRTVLEFADLVEKHGRYCIVSGYVAILLGMERPTQDVDVVADISNPDGFGNALNGHGFETALIPGMFGKLYEKGEKIDIFTKNQWYFDFRRPVNKWALKSIREPLVIAKAGNEFRVSPPEIQIPYKLWLGSDKDIKDAAFIYERLKGIIRMDEMERNAREMGVELELIL